ncbi:MAG: PEP/pyruvate-binding domain-containing protein [Flavobacteriales bacterium]
MKRAGFRVPEGFVINASAFEDFFIRKKEFSEHFKNEVQNALSAIPANGYMVRSSAIGEDGEGNSFAGQLESFQAANNINDVLAKLLLCWKSYQKDQVAVYQKTSGVQLKGMAVIMQQLIAPDYAGVIFSRHPMNEKNILVEYIEGHGEQLVSGKVNPHNFTFSRDNQTFFEKTPFSFDEGIAATEALELLYSQALDIEWAIKDNTFYIVQCRPITTATKSKRVYWSNTNVNENYPEAITPLLYSIARESYYHYFKNLSRLFLISSEKIQELEAAYANVIAVHGCKMYYNMSSIHEIISASPFSEMLLKSFDNFVGYNQEKKTETKEKGSKLRFIREVIRFNSSLEKTVKTFENHADLYQQQAQKAIALEEIKHSFHDFIEIRMHSWYRASLADFFAMLYHGLLGKFCAKYYDEKAEGIHNQLIQAIPNLISSEPIVLMYTIKLALRKDPETYKKFIALSAEEFWEEIKTRNSEAHKLILRYLKEFGFRCSGELMLTSKTYTEEPARFIDLLKQYDALPDANPEELIAQKAKEREQVLRDFKKTIWKKNGINIFKSITHVTLLKSLIRLAYKGISARERVRLKQASLYFQFKKIVEKCGSEFQKRKFLDNANDVFYLRYSEIIEALNSSSMLPSAVKKQVQLSKEHFTTQSTLVYPDDFFSNLGEFPSPEELPSKNTTANGHLKGLCACGGKIQARVTVLHSVMEAHKLKKGDILVTRQTDPGWVVVFPLISGLIVERGGMLSHGAIVSREFGIPAVVGVEKATSQLKDGDTVVLNAFTGEITLVNE